MDGQDRQAIEGLFEKLADVERRGQPRDPEAEDFIAQRIARQPGAPYYMAQTIVMQEQALAAAQARIEEMEREAASQGSSGGGLFSGLFGGGGRPSRASEMPRVPRRRAQESYPPQGAYPPMSGGYAARGGGGFLAGAAQTAMGVAGGVLLGNAIGGMFADEAAAAEGFMDESSEEPMEEPAADEAGFDDGGGDMEF